jgi:hypothetical protein
MAVLHGLRPNGYLCLRRVRVHRVASSVQFSCFFKLYGKGKMELPPPPPKLQDES